MHDLIPIEVTYRWPVTGEDPNEINESTMVTYYIPRFGELVTLKLIINEKETVTVTKRIKDVIWTITNNTTHVLVLMN